MTILDEIAAKTRIRVTKAKETASMEFVQTKALEPAATEQQDNGPNGPLAASFPFEKAIASPGLSFICEVKKASPSKGIIAEDFPFLSIAKDYEAGGASAISVLTEPEYFLGSDLYLKEISAAVKIPVLRKDFIIDPYQIYEAKILGANAVLLICAILDTETTASYIKIASGLNMSALVEIHNEAEIEQAVQAGAKIIGINNRDLKTFKVDINTAAALRNLIPSGILTVAESGVKSPEDISAIKKNGFDAVLIGESLMRAPDKKQFLVELKKHLH